MKTPFLIKFCLVGSIATTLFVACSTHDSDERFLFITSLFTGVEQFENLSRAHDIFPTSTLTAADDPYVFDLTDQIELPDEFSFRDKVVNVDEFIRRTDTAALLILKDGVIHYENYWLTGGKNVHWMSMSVAKSYISALVGIAIDQGHIGNIFEPVTQYVSQLKDSAYDGVSIKDILQMSSGARWSEDYSDADSDVMRSARILAVGGSLDQFSASLTNEFQPGTFNRYNSTDTQVLGMLLREATGVSVTQYMQEVLWSPIGAENNAYWLLDSKDMELVYAGLNATARDYAKLGEVFRLKGRFNGQQIVPSKWVEASITPDAPHLLPGNNPLSDFPLGYGYQWWIPDESGDFMAIGVYNQFIYISPKNNLVIVKLSANNAYGISEEISANSEFEAISFFKTVAGLSIGSSDSAKSK